MLADVLAWINTHYLTLLLLMLAGACFVFAALVFIFVVRRRDVVLGELDVPTWTEPDTSIPLPPKAHLRIEDADTHVVARIPGATPELTPQLAAVARYLGDAEATHAIEGLRVIPSPDLGPVCPICGGPFHAVCPSAPKSAPEQTQVVDLCPLTTQDIVIDAVAPHFAETFTRHPRAELGTQELSGSLARAKERVA